MKKIISSAVLLTVLVGAVTMIVGCGEKPAKESVWTLTPTKEEANQVTELAFHSDGYLYVTKYNNAGTATEVKKVGKYSTKNVERTKIISQNPLKTKTTTAQRILISDDTGKEIGWLTYTESKDTLQIKDQYLFDTAAFSPNNYKCFGVYKKDPSKSIEDIKKAAVQ